MSETRDGFAIKTLEGAEEIHFVPCTYGDNMRERVLMGLLARTDTDRYFVADTRDEPGPAKGEAAE